MLNLIISSLVFGFTFASILIMLTYADFNRACHNEPRVSHAEAFIVTGLMSTFAFILVFVAAKILKEYLCT